MASRSPLDRLMEVAIGTLKVQVAAADMVLEHAKGTVAVGRMLAGQMARVAVGTAADLMGAPARPEGPGAGPETARGPVAKPAPVPTKPPMRTTAPDPAAPAPAKKAPAAKAPAAKAPAAKAPANKAPAAKAPAKRTPSKRASTKTAPGARPAATGDTPRVTPADIADQVSKRPATKTTTSAAPTRKTTKKAPAKRAPAKRAPAKRAPARRAPTRKTAPPTAREVADVEDGPEVTTPVGTTAADAATNPDTTEHDLQQPGTEPLLDPATAKAVRSEQETLGRAADTDKG